MELRNVVWKFYLPERLGGILPMGTRLHLWSSISGAYGVKQPAASEPVLGWPQLPHPGMPSGRPGKNEKPVPRM